MRIQLRTLQKEAKFLAQMVNSSSYFSLPSNPPTKRDHIMDAAKQDKLDDDI